MKYLILGASAAGLSAAKTLRKLDSSSIITIVSEDRDIYSRSMLHQFINGKRSLAEINFVEEDFFKKYDVNWIKGVKATGVNTYRKEVQLSNNLIEVYDKLLIATGASPSIPHNIEHIGRARHVYGLRTIEDAQAIKDRLEEAKSVIILGGGLIGINIASELLNKDIDLNILEYGNNILALQLNVDAARAYQNKFKKAGVNIYTNVVATQALVDQDNNFQGLLLSNEEVIEADMLIVSVGVHPNVDFLKDSDIMINCGVLAIGDDVLREGVVVNRKCQTNVKDVYAAGDVCAEKLHVWPLAVKQGIVAAYNMALQDREMESLFGMRNSMNYFRIPTVSIGDPNLLGQSYTIDVLQKPDSYMRIISQNNRIKSLIMQGDIAGAGVYEALITRNVDISQIRKRIFDLGYHDFFQLDEKGEFDLDNII